MKKNVTIYASGEPDQVVEAECYYQLTVTSIVSGVQLTRYLRADSIKELEPKKVLVEGIGFIRYLGENKEYIEFLANAIVFRQLQYVEDLPPRAPSQRERDHMEIEESASR